MYKLLRKGKMRIKSEVLSRPTEKARRKNPRAIAVSGQAQAVTTSYLKDNSGKDISWLEPGQSGGSNFLLRDDTGKVEAVKVFTSCACE